VTLAHGAAVATALSHGRLAVLPGTHALPVENPGVVNALLTWFLAGATPAVDWPTPGPGRCGGIAVAGTLQAEGRHWELDPLGSWAGAR
jgi:hypothetical protein